MPNFSCKMNNTDTFRFLGSFPCYGWMAALNTQNPRIPNTPDNHISHIRVSFTNMEEWAEIDGSFNRRDFYFAKMIEFAESSQVLKGRLSLAPTVVNRSGSNTDRYGNSVEIHLEGIEMDVLMIHLFMIRNLAMKSNFPLFEYLLNKDVPLKLSALLASSFYVARGGFGGGWCLDLHSGDSTILTQYITKRDIRNFAYGSGFVGHQPKWGENDYPMGYVRDGGRYDRGATDDNGRTHYIVDGLLRNEPDREANATDNLVVGFNRFGGNHSDDWSWFNSLVTEMTGKDFGITLEDANDKIRRVGR